MPTKKTDKAEPKPLNQGETEDMREAIQKK